MSTAPTDQQAASDEACHNPGETAAATSRREYAWSFFDHHAKQRMTMFNFFLVFNGFVINALGVLGNGQRFIMALFVALLGAWSSILFLFLERRNEELVDMAEDMLAYSEKELFGGNTWSSTCGKSRWPLGTSDGITKEHQAGMILRERESTTKPSHYRHGTWIPVFQISLASIYAIVACALLGLEFWTKILRLPCIILNQ